MGLGHWEWLNHHCGLWGWLTLWPLGMVQSPPRDKLSKKKLEGLPIGVVRPPPGQLVYGWFSHPQWLNPLKKFGGFAHGGGRTTPSSWGWSLFCFSFFFFLFFFSAMGCSNHPIDPAKG
jgi:hypothetical protein